MTLDEYLTDCGMTEAAFAEQIGRSPSFVNRLRRGHAWPLRETLERIRDATSGAVTANDFLGPVAPPSDAGAAA